MKLHFPKILRRLSRAKEAPRSPVGEQAGFWSAPRSAATLPGNPVVVKPETAIENPVQNPFAAATSPTAEPTEKLNPWERWLTWVGWRPPTGARRRVFTNLEQLELVLGRPRSPARNQNLEEGQSVRARRSGSVAGRSKVIYESPPVVAVDATRMMEESDRAYARLRGRRTETMRVTAD